MHAGSIVRKFLVSVKNLTLREVVIFVEQKQQKTCFFDMKQDWEITLISAVAISVNMHSL